MIRLWVRMHDVAEQPRRWIVFASDGREIAQVETSDRFDVHDIGEDWILGTIRDETGVPTVQLLPLQKQGAE